VVEASPGDPRFSEALRIANGLVVRTYTRVDKPLLEGAPELRVVARAGVGLDNIDLDACRERGIAVVHTPDANTSAVVEHVFANMLDAVRPRATVDPTNPLADSNQWKLARDAAVTPRELSECALGILGMGRIGTRVARVAAAFGMGVRYHDLREIEERDRHGAQPVDLKSLFSLSDLVTLHVDGRPDNRGLIGASELAWLKPGAVLINTSRGFVAPPEPLAQWLGRDPSAQAFIDVHEPEPFGPDYPLLARPNAHLTPHTASATRSAKVRMSWVVRDVCRVLDGETPRHRAV